MKEQCRLDIRKFSFSQITITLNGTDTITADSVCPSGASCSPLSVCLAQRRSGSFSAIRLMTRLDTADA